MFSRGAEKRVVDLGVGTGWLVLGTSTRAIRPFPKQLACWSRTRHSMT
jgi:hypothetical protein